MISDLNPPPITYGYLSGLDNDKLLDLLQIKTHHLLAATSAHLPDPTFITSIKVDVEKIQSEIRARRML